MYLNHNFTMTYTIMMNYEFSSLSIFAASDKMAYLKELGRAIPTGMQFGSQREACIKIDTDLESATLVYMGMSSTTVLKLEVSGTAVFIL